jgi:hypothetical protein
VGLKVELVATKATIMVTVNLSADRNTERTLAACQGRPRFVGRRSALSFWATFK